MTTTKSKATAVGSMTYKKADGGANKGAAKNGEPRVPGGETAIGLRTAKNPGSEGAAVSHVKTHIC